MCDKVLSALLNRAEGNHFLSKMKAKKKDGGKMYKPPTYHALKNAKEQRKIFPKMIAFHCLAMELRGSIPMKSISLGPYCVPSTAPGTHVPFFKELITG